MLFLHLFLLGTIFCVAVVKYIGKRNIFLISLSGAMISNVGLGLFQLFNRLKFTLQLNVFIEGIFGFCYLPPNVKSFENANSPNYGNEGSYFPAILIIILRFCSIGLMSVPFMYASEIFPLKTRCFAAGTATALSNISLFISTKTFYDLEYWLNLPTSLCIYGTIAAIG